MAMRTILHKFERNHIFTEQEAWLLFRLAAFGEAIGWTLLIAGILIEQYVIPGNHVAVTIAGRIHGVLFILYALAAGLYPNLKWPRWQALLAVLASVPPYGSLGAERFAAYRRNSEQAKHYYLCMSYHVAAPLAA